VNTKKMIMTVMFLTAIYIVFAEQAIGNDTGDRRIISGERCTKYVAVSVSQSRRETLEDILNIMKHVRDIKKLEDIIKEKIENNIQTKKCQGENFTVHRFFFIIANEIYFSKIWFFVY